MFVAAVQAVWGNIAKDTRKWALVGAGVSNSAISVLIIFIVAEARWAQALIQLDVLKILGVIFACTNAIVVIALAGVGVKGQGPGGFGFDVHADDPPPAKFVAEGTITQEAPK